jgi:RHS repeat-associated protein
MNEEPNCDYQSGQLLRVKDANAPTTVFWQANATNAAGQVIDDQLGNGLQRVRGRDQVTGRLDYVQTGPGGSATVQNLSYSWNRLGYLTQRTDVRQGSLTEAFFYDNLHRLDYSTLGGVTNLDVSYDAMGNLTWRSDVGSYSYHATKKHAVVSAGGVGYGYDAGGQMTTRNGQAISWKSYALPSLINGSGGSSSEFFYTPERQRWKQQASYAGTSEQTIYIGGLIEKVTRGGQTAWRHAIRAAEGTVAIYTRESGGSNAIHYPLGDHLGSVEAITDGAGAVAVRLSYAPFGQRRNAAGWSGNPSAGDWAGITATTRHGYTGHEHLDNLSLIHMNGRVYDPYIGRFTSADPLIDGAALTAGWNRYSYVRNNPLSFTDPSGFESQDCGYYCRKDGRNRPDPGPAWEVPGVLGDVVIEAKKLWDKLQIELFKADYRGMDPGEGIGGTGSELEEVVVTGEKPQSQKEKRGDFHYLVRDFAFCKADKLFSQFSKPDGSAPGAPAAIPGTTPDIVLTGGNPITQIVDASARTITNVTQDGHRYHSGTVEIRITSTWYGSGVSIEGRGAGPHYWENSIAGSILFSALAAKATISCTFGAN